MNLDSNWAKILKNELKKDYFIKLMHTLEYEYKTYNIFPEYENIFRAYNLTPFDKIKVVIIGQDPYPNKGQGNGLAFSVNDNVKIPKSLINIYKEIESSINVQLSQNGNLDYLAKRGVFLLNSTLTVREKEPNSHENIGWKYFTDETIRLISMKKEPVVFMLWGNNAKRKKEVIDINNNLILEANHPSPLSAYRGFFGCNHFSKANHFLISNNIEPINWVNN